MISGSGRLRAMVAALALAGTALSAIPAAAQSDAEARLRKIEQEVRALQRSVFPGGDGRFFEAEIDPAGNPIPADPVGPSTTAVTDILGRLDSIEAQLARLTSAIEVNSNDIVMLSSRLEPFENERDARLAQERAAAEAQARAEAEAAAAAAAAPSAERIAAVQAITKPSSGDAGDDEYVYGFRLWQERFFPEAQQQLRMFVDKYPAHWRTTYARNLLGRAFYDDGKPDEAARWFLDNYLKDKAGDRAPDSLLYLAETMIATNDTRKACSALTEFSQNFQALATGRLAQQYEANVAKVKCN